ncbi:conserved Plasmodium protein, unknown function [Plasmodium gonderi]|uniref:Uncharacterized protein n=1 Tax=Plasmodium gonderi TaxID=77519 RepID=A0A1Y1JBU7_PLAGO|nr:conserved Plasmodium protein, unknown function [Plasmodium gonderi]GAW79966.1 conserved Plasmodium protein, unknown function [Plasmodium gonderi]
MYYKEYYTYDVIYPAYYSGYVLYEVPKEKNICCSLAEVLCSCFIFTATVTTSIFLVSADVLLRCCDGRDYS